MRIEIHKLVKNELLNPRWQYSRYYSYVQWNYSRQNNRSLTKMPVVEKVLKIVFTDWAKVLAIAINSMRRVEMFYYSPAHFAVQ